MFVTPNPTVLSERRLSRAELGATAFTWTIRFDVPYHPGMSQGAHLFRSYSGLDVTVAGTSGADKLTVTATGTAAELRRLLEWTDDLYLGRGVNLTRAFAGERFMEPQHLPPPGRGLN